MEILGIGPGELIVILILLLVVVGPERLPDLARQAGRALVRVRNWIQQSPDAAMVLRARQEIEQELALLRNSLLEVQSVRDEVLGAARQVGDSVGALAATRLDMDSLIGGAPPAPPQDNAAPEPAAPEPAPAIEPPAAPHSIAPLAPPPGTVAHGSQPLVAAPTPSEVQDINLRLQALMTDLWALQEQLKRRGLLTSDWQPPSYAMHLPQPDPDAPNGQIEEVV
jgi:sec-independent protein translocase protein TatB